MLLTILQCSSRSSTLRNHSVQCEQCQVKNHCSLPTVNNSALKIQAPHLYRLPGFTSDETGFGTVTLHQSCVIVVSLADLPLFVHGLPFHMWTHARPCHDQIYEAAKPPGLSSPIMASQPCSSSSYNNRWSAWKYQTILIFTACFLKLAVKPFKSLTEKNKR